MLPEVTSFTLKYKTDLPHYKPPLDYLLYPGNYFKKKIQRSRKDLKIESRQFFGHLPPKNKTEIILLKCEPSIFEEFSMLKAVTKS